MLPNRVLSVIGSVVTGSIKATQPRQLPQCLGLHSRNLDCTGYRSGSHRRMLQAFALLRSLALGLRVRLCERFFREADGPTLIFLLLHLKNGRKEIMKLKGFIFKALLLVVLLPISAIAQTSAEWVAKLEEMYKNSSAVEITFTSEGRNFSMTLGPTTG